MATAAAVWATGAIGASVGYGYYVLALALCVLSLFILGPCRTSDAESGGCSEATTSLRRKAESRMVIANFSALSAIDTLVVIVTAYLLALPLGWERKTKGKAHIGWRTLPLVSIGTCAYLLISRDLYERGIFDADGPARTLRAMMTGIGFIGGGAILEGKKAVTGVTTATSVWTTGAIGASVAYGYYTVAVALTLANLLVVDITRRLARHTGAPHDDAGRGRDP